MTLQDCGFLEEEYGLLDLWQMMNASLRALLPTLTPTAGWGGGREADELNWFRRPKKQPVTPFPPKQRWKNYKGKCGDK